MGKLDSLLAAKTGGNTRDPVAAASLALLEKLTQDRSISNTQLANAIAKGLDAMFTELSKAISAIDGAKDRAGMAKSLAQTQSEVAGLVKAIDRSKNDMQRAIETAVKSLSIEISGSNAKDAVEQLKAAIQAVELPSADFAPVLKRIDKTNKMLETLIMQTAKTNDSAEKWSFEVEREDYSDKIKNVVATRET